MALSRVKTWTAGEVLFASDQNAEFNNILNNALSLISPLTGTLDVNSNALSNVGSIAFASGGDITALDELAFTDAATGATASGRLRRNGTALEWHDGTASRDLLTEVSQLLPRGYLAGLTLSNNSGDATNDIDIAAGEARDSTDAADIVLASALTKRLDAAWAVGTNQGGLDTGAIADDTYHVWLIKRSDTGVVDALFSISPTAPTMPTNYDFRRLIGSIVRTGGAIKAFTQTGDYFEWTTPVSDISATNAGTSAVTRTLTIPTDRVLEALVSMNITNGATANNIFCYLSPLTTTDEAASAARATAASGNTAAGNGAWRGRIKTNTSAQIRSRQDASDANSVLSISTLGWYDRRGRDD